MLIISIHALREEGDPTQRIEYIGLNKFLSTPSARRATLCRVLHRQAGRISIHALREEGDHRGRDCIHAPHISIHALREEGDFKPHKHTPKIIYISIHALREEGDLCSRS